MLSEHMQLWLTRMQWIMGLGQLKVSEVLHHATLTSAMLTSKDCMATANPEIWPRGGDQIFSFNSGQSRYEHIILVDYNSVY